MLRLINARSGGVMWVHESRVDEYLAAGHKLAAAPAQEPVQEPAAAPAKTENKAKKTTKRK